jgi:hypothetical protein
MSESELYSGTEPVEEDAEGFTTRHVEDPSALDSEVDFDDEEFTDDEPALISEEEAGNAEGGQDAHLDDPERIAEDDNF